MAKQDLGKMLSQSAARSAPVEIRRGKGVGLSVEEQAVENPLEPQVLWVDLDRLLDNPYQHEEDINPDDYAALVESIKVDGFQGALNVSPVEDREGYYFLTGGGHQRRNAAREAGLKKIPVFIAASPAEKKQLGLRLARENTAQVNRSPVNLGFLYIQLIEEFGMTQEEIAAEIKKDRYHVNFAIMAARSATDIRAALREKYSPRVMTYLRRLEHEGERAPIITQYLSGELTVEGVRVTVEKVQDAKKRPTEQWPQDAPSVPLSNAEMTSQESVVAQKETSTLVVNTREEALAELRRRHADHEPVAREPSVLDEAASRERSTSAEGETTSQVEATPTDDEKVREQADAFTDSERVSKVQAAFSRIETYRRHIEKKRADGERVLLSGEEEALLGKIIDRCHTLLDTYGKRVV